VAERIVDVLEVVEIAPARESKRLLAALQSEIDPTSLERLLVEGKELDQEAVCALALENAPSA
jgi:hypothetical protein